ncbi:SpoIIE family protein phosphatase [Streptomyces sp. NRRL B-24720]|uniref:SpoIIE family protein phosphatase n=1 Tax=Streptomyces sp. NRRL B-24720 TaxID=1476876 RepID=UPI0004C76A93|nr:SpoIIE family protein phosphatase [Streptomyces sp. NRRL B-24720]
MRPPAGAGVECLDLPMADVMRDTGASIGLLCLLPPGERSLWLALVSGASRRITAPWARTPLDTPSAVVDAIHQRQVIWLGSQEEIARRYPQLSIMLPYAFKLAAVPLTSGTRVWGGLALLWPVRHPLQLSPHERDAIAAFCGKAAQLLEQADSHGRPLLPPEEPRVLPAPPRQAVPAHALAALRFTERLPAGCCELDPDGRITFINSAGAELVGANPTALMGNHPWDVLQWLNNPVFEDHYRSAVITRQATSFTAVRPPDTPLLFQLHPSDSGISVHITPAARQEATTPQQAPPSGEPVGAMVLYHLTHLSAALSEAVDVHDVVDIVADQIVPAFGPQGLVLLTIEEGRLHAIGHRGYSAEFINRFDGAPLTSHTPTTHTIATGSPAFFPTFADFRRTYPDAPRYQDRSAWAFLPLTASGRRIGSLALSYDQPRSFPPAERATLTSLSGLIAQALDRARLYDAKHALAHTLQTSLLPRALPRIPGLDVAARYLPAGHGMDIGGDFYDLIQGTPAITAAIGDVQGHNTAAAALMGQVRTAVHAHATLGTPPGDLLARTNRLLTDLDVGLFTSCLIAHLDLTHHRTRLATAGHPPPLLRHPDGHTEVLRVPPGLPLGIDPDADYPTTEITLPPGSVLALYTDGLVETPGTDIDESTDALAQHLGQAQSPHLDELADTLIRHAERSTPRNDDIALLLIRPQPHGE